VYLGTTIPAAIRAEEAHLREKFGTAYEAYATRRHVEIARAFSWGRARENREHHTIAGVLATLGALLLKLVYDA
jgi:hypothetical protein